MALLEALEPQKLPDSVDSQAKQYCSVYIGVQACESTIWGFLVFFTLIACSKVADRMRGYALVRRSVQKIFMGAASNIRAFFRSTPLLAHVRVWRK